MQPSSTYSRTLVTSYREGMLLLTLRSTLVIATFVAFALCDDPTIMVDDTDGRIQYSSSWLRNTIADPTEKNYGGTSSFTNISQSTATLAFEGGKCPSLHTSDSSSELTRER